MARRYTKILLIFVLFTLAACSKNLSITIEMPKEEIQKKLGEKFPMTPPKDKAPLEMTLSNPTVILEEGKDQIGVQVNVVAEPTAPEGKPALPANLPIEAPERKPEIKKPALPGPGPKALPIAKPAAKLPPTKAPSPPPAPKLRFTGTVTVFATITYDPTTKSIRLSNPKVTKLDVAQLPDAFNQPLTDIAREALTEKFAQQPIPLENKTELEKAVSPFLKSVTVKNGKVFIELGL